MYVAVLGIIAGQALLFHQSSLVLYASIVGVAMFAFVRLYEEPLLAHRYGRVRGLQKRGAGLAAAANAVARKRQVSPCRQ